LLVKPLDACFVLVDEDLFIGNDGGIGISLFQLGD
jgi:hypothetical protein